MLLWVAFVILSSEKSCEKAKSIKENRYEGEWEGRAISVLVNL